MDNTTDTVDIIRDKRFLSLRIDVPERRNRINYVAAFTGAQSATSAIDTALAVFQLVSRRMPALLAQATREE